jgi:hypothetical protein
MKVLTAMCRQAKQVVNEFRECLILEGHISDTIEVNRP